MALNGSLLIDQLAPVDRSQTNPARSARTERSPADARTDADAGSGSFDAALRESTAEKPEPRATKTSDRSNETAATETASGTSPEAETDTSRNATGASDKTSDTGSEAGGPGETPAEDIAFSGPSDGETPDSQAAALPVAGATGTAPVLGNLLGAAGVTTDIVLEGAPAAARGGLAGAVTDAAEAILPGSEARPAAGAGAAGAAASGTGADAAETPVPTVPRSPVTPTPAGTAAVPADNPSTAVRPDLAAAVKSALAEEGLTPDVAKSGSTQGQPSAPTGSVEPALSPDAAKALTPRPVPGFENALVRGTRVEGAASGPVSPDADAALTVLDGETLDDALSDGDLLPSSRSRVAAEAGTGSNPTQAAVPSTSLAGLQGAVSGAAGRFAALVGQGAAGQAEAADLPAGLGGLEAAGAVKPDTAFATLTPQAVSEAAGPRTLSPAIVSAAGAIARGAAAGENRFSIRLDPPELGRVDVRLKIGDDGVARAHLIVERSETLDLFLRDQRNLERALEQAGVKTDAASLQFSLKGDGDGQAGFAASEGNDASGLAGSGAEDPDAVDLSASDPSDRSHDGVLNITI